VVAAVADGETNKGIAERFRVSEDTVKHHLSSVFDKVGVSSRLELAVFGPTLCCAGLLLTELGKMFLVKGDLEQARTRLEKAVKYMPDSPSVHYQLGLLYRRLGQPEKSQQHFQLSKQP